MRLREHVGHEGCASDGTCADRRAEQECAARLIMFGHGLSPPVVRFLRPGGPAEHRTCRTLSYRVREVGGPLRRAIGQPPTRKRTLPPDEHSSRRRAAGLAT
jgi:hypothetical protein